MNKGIEIGKKYSLEEFIKLDETGTSRHEFYNGKLIEMPGETLLHNEICIRILMIFASLLGSKGWKTYIESVKVKIGNDDIYLYPDIVVVNADEEGANSNSSYILYHPALIAEVLSDTTRKHDSTDKFIQYQKIDSLRYYLHIEPEKHVVLFYEKDDSGEWSARTFTNMDEVIPLPFFPAQFALGDIYLS